MLSRGMRVGCSLDCEQRGIHDSTITSGTANVSISCIDSIALVSLPQRAAVLPFPSRMRPCNAWGASDVVGRTARCSSSQPDTRGTHSTGEGSTGVESTRHPCHSPLFSLLLTCRVCVGVWCLLSLVCLSGGCAPIRFVVFGSQPFGARATRRGGHASASQPVGGREEATPSVLRETRSVHQEGEETTRDRIEASHLPPSLFVHC